MRRFAGHLTLAQRLMAILAVAIVPAIAALVYFIGAVYLTREREVGELAFRTSEIAALEMERITSGAEAVLRTLSFSPVMNGEAAACRAYVQLVSDSLTQFMGFAVVGPGGVVSCDAGLSLQPAEVAELVRADAPHTAGGLVIGTYKPGPDGGSYLPVALPAGGRLLVAGIDLQWLEARLHERNLARGSALAVVGHDGIIIAREPNPRDYVGKPVTETFQALLDDRVGGTLKVTSVDGVRRIIGYQPPAATGIGLYVGAGLPVNAAYASLANSTLWSVGLALAGAAAACLLAWTVGDRLFRRPIRRILATVDSWRAGDQTARTLLVPDGGELGELGAAIDEYMDGIVESEAHRQLLLREMNHRIKNLLANVQAVANQTFRDGAGPDSLRAFGQRLAAMAAAHDLLVSGNGQSADLEATIRAALEPFGVGRDAEITLAGPPLRLNSRAALALAMSLHELCTNAAKYGALSGPGGSVAVHWSVGPGTGDEERGDRLRLSWIEQGGPAVAEPSRRGFGTRLIHAAFAADLGARTDLRFPSAGAQFTLDADAALVLA